MARSTIFFLVILVLLLIAVVFVECNQKAAQDARMQKVLEEHAQQVGLGLSGRLASGYQGLVGTKIFPSAHQHLGGNRPCRLDGSC